MPLSDRWKRRLKILAIALTLLVLESLIIHFTKNYWVKFADALAWCFAFTPKGMLLLRELGFPHAVVIRTGTQFGACATLALGMIAYSERKRLAWIKEDIDDIKAFINRYFLPLPAVGKSSSLSLLLLYALIAIVTFFDLWAGLGIARAMPQIKKYVVIPLTVCVSIVRNHGVGAGLVWLETNHPGIAHHSQALAWSLLLASGALVQAYRYFQFMHSAKIATPCPESCVLETDLEVE